MTAKARANLYYYAAISLGFLGAVTIAIGRASSSGALTGLGVILIVSFVLLSAIGLTTNRCPHCRRYIDLRGPSAYCPRCGQWIPAREGEAMPHGERLRG
jgi:hypothetical protein